MWWLAAMWNVASTHNVGLRERRLDVAALVPRGHQAAEEPVWLVGLVAA